MKEEVPPMGVAPAAAAAREMMAAEFELRAVLEHVRGLDDPATAAVLVAYARRICDRIAATRLQMGPYLPRDLDERLERLCEQARALDGNDAGPSGTGNHG